MKEVSEMADKDSSESEILLEELRRHSKEREEQHQENIQILVALSLFAGYITAFFNNLFDNFALNVATTGLAAIVFVFLLYKLILNSHIANGDVLASDRTDRIFSSLYLFSVVGFGFVAIFIVAAEQFEISIQSIGPETVMTAYAASAVPFMLILFTWVGRKKKQTLHSQEERLRDRFPKALEMLEEGDILDSQKKQVLIDRLEGLLDKDRQREPPWLWLGSLAMMEADNFTTLTRSDRSLLLSILERVARRDEYGEYEEDDLRKIEAIIEEAEES